MSKEISVQVADRIDHVDEEEWNELRGGRPFTSHRCLRLTETALAHHEPRYLQIRRRGRLEAGMICAIQRHFYLSTYLPTRALQTLVGQALARFPPLSCAIPIVCEPGLLVRPDCDAGSLIPFCLEAMRDLATQERAFFVGLAHLSPSNVAWPALSRARYHSTHLPADTYLEIGWSSFEDYQASLPHKKRSEFRRVRRRAGEAGVKIEVLRPCPETEPRLRQLVRNVCRRHNFHDPYAPDLFLRAAQVLGEDLHLLVARQEDELVACLAMLRSEDEVIIKWAGLDYDRTLDNFTYHLIMTESVPQAIEMGARRLRLGSTVYRLKKLMGAALEERFLALALQSRTMHHLAGLGLILSRKRAAPSQPASAVYDHEGV